jgi:hypothetical protein
MSYEEFLTSGNYPDCKLSWVLWKTRFCGMTLHDAIESADKEWK